MWCVFFGFLHIIYYRTIEGVSTNHSYNELRWKVTHDDLFRDSLHLPPTDIILPHKPLRIILEDFFYAVSTLDYCCNKLNLENFTTTFEPYKEANINSSLLIKVDQVTPNMSTEWLCRVWRSKYQNITFTIHIKGKEKVNINIGRERLHHALTELSVVDYEGFREHRYVSGETINLVCHRDDVSDAKGSIQLTYYNSNGTILFETEKISAVNPIYLIKTMNVNNDNEYVDCTYISTADIHYTYRTMFKYKPHKTSNNPLKISVDDMMLMSATDDEREEYLYRFFDNQSYTVTCEMDHVPGKLKLTFENSPFNNDVVQNTGTDKISRQSIKISYTTKKFNSTKLLCVAETNSTKYSAEILLLTDEREIYIKGLHKHDIIQQYNTNSITWTIDYWFTPGQTLSLTCVTPYVIKKQWISRNKAGEIDVKNDAKKNYVITLSEEQNGTDIICHTLHGRAILHLIIRPTGAANDSLMKEYITLGGALVSVIIIIGLGCLICHRRRVKTAQRESCNNLPNNIDSQIPAYPSQWDSPDYINTEEAMATNSLYITTNSPMYACPLKKSERGIKPKDQSEAIYNVPHDEGFDGDEGNDYVNSGFRCASIGDDVYTETVEPLYCDL